MSEAVPELPAGWEWSTLGEVCDIVGGATPDTKDPSLWGGDVAWLAVSDLTGYEEKFISQGARTITRLGYESCSTQLMPAGAVVFSSRAPIGYVAIASAPVCTSQGFKSLVPGDLIESDYLYWYLKWIKPLAESMASGTTFKELSGKGAARLRVPVPPRSEQCEISGKLDAIHADVIRPGREEVAEVRSLIRAYRASGLHDAFSGTENLVSILDVAAVVSGQTPKGLSSAESGDIPYYKVGDMNSAVGAVMGDARIYVNAAIADQFKLKVRPAGTVLFPKRGGAIATNKKRILDRPAAFDLNTMGLVPSEQLDPQYLLYWLETIDLAALSDGSQVPQINNTDIARLQIPLASPERQREVVRQAERALRAHAATERDLEIVETRVLALWDKLLTQLLHGHRVGTGLRNHEPVIGSYA